MRGGRLAGGMTYGVTSLVAALAFTPSLGISPALASPGLVARGNAVVAVPGPTDASGPGVPALPATPWMNADRWTLDAEASTPVVATADGYAVATASPWGITFLALTGDVRAQAVLPRAAAMPLAATGDGAVIVADDTGRVTVVAPDGTLRGGGSVDTTPVAGPFVRPDGSYVVMGSPGHGVTVTGFTAAGDPCWSRTLRSTLASASTPVVLTSGAIVFQTASGSASGAATLGWIDRTDAVTQAPTGHPPGGLSAMAHGRFAAAAGTEVLICAASGEVTARAELGGPIGWIAPAGEDRVAVFRTGPATELVQLDGAGTVVGRTPCPADATPPVMDPTGVLLVMSHAGEVLAVEPDGTVRWRIHLHTRLRPPAVARAGGGVVVATAGRALIALH